MDTSGEKWAVYTTDRVYWVVIHCQNKNPVIKFAQQQIYSPTTNLKIANTKFVAHFDMSTCPFCSMRMRRRVLAYMLFVTELVFNHTEPGCPLSMMVCRLKTTPSISAADSPRKAGV